MKKIHSKVHPWSKTYNYPNEGLSNTRLVNNNVCTAILMLAIQFSKIIVFLWGEGVNIGAFLENISSKPATHAKTWSNNKENFFISQQFSLVGGHFLYCYNLSGWFRGWYFKELLDVGQS